MIGWWVGFAVAGACEWAGPVPASDLESVVVSAGGREVAHVVPSASGSWEARTAPVDVGVSTDDGVFRVRLAADGVELSGTSPTFPMWAARPLPTDRPWTWWVGPVVATSEPSGVGVAPRPSARAPSLSDPVVACEDVSLLRVRGVDESLGGPGVDVVALPESGVRLAADPGGEPTLEVPDWASAVLLEIVGDHVRVRATDGSVAVVGWTDRSEVVRGALRGGVAGGVVGGHIWESSGTVGMPVVCTGPLVLRTPSGIEFGRVLPGTPVVHAARVAGDVVFPEGGPFWTERWPVSRADLALAGCAAVDPDDLPTGLGPFGQLLGWAARPATGDVNGWTWGDRDAFFEGRVGDVDLVGVISPAAPEFGAWVSAVLGGRYTASPGPVGAAYDSRDADGAARHREIRCVALAGEGLSGATRGVACTLASNDVRLHVAAVGPGIGTARKVARRYDASVLALLDDWSVGR